MDPSDPFEGEYLSEDGGLTWALQWVQGIADPISESYVNLIPTSQGGTHVNGTRSGLTEALKEFCDFRNLIPRGVKLTADDIWLNCSSIISAKVKDPQFTGQTKERLSSKEFTNISSQIIKDSFSLWLNQHTEEGETIEANSIEFFLGGKGANQAVALARLGAKVSFVGTVGKDLFGQDLESLIEREKVKIKNLSRKKGQSGVALINVLKDGRNEVVAFPGINKNSKSKQA